MILGNLEQLGNFLLPIDSLKQANICSAKKILLPILTFTGISVSSIAFELSKIPISLSASYIVIVWKEKHSLVNSEVIEIMLGCFLYLTVAFKVGWSMFPEKESKFSNFLILKLITTFE